MQVLTGSWDIEEHILETIPMVLLFYINWNIGPWKRGKWLGVMVGFLAWDQGELSYYALGLQGFLGTLKFYILAS